jgi:hypothetical protein
MPVDLRRFVRGARRWWGLLDPYAPESVLGNPDAADAVRAGQVARDLRERAAAYEAAGWPWEARVAREALAAHQRLVEAEGTRDEGRGRAAHHELYARLALLRAADATRAR